MVLVEFPHPGTRSLGLVTNSLRDVTTGRTILTVCVLTGLMPPAGFTLFVPEESVTNIAWSVNETLQSILSGGITAPVDDPLFRGASNTAGIRRRAGCRQPRYQVRDPCYFRLVGWASFLPRKSGIDDRVFHQDSCPTDGPVSTSPWIFSGVTPARSNASASERSSTAGTSASASLRIALRTQ